MKLKSLLSNKNVVTVIGAILIVAVLYGFYSWRVNQAITPIKVAYAKNTIAPRTQIKKEDIDYLDIQASAIRGKIYSDEKQIIGKYTNVNVTIPAGSLFYQDVLVNSKELPDAYLQEMILDDENLIPFNFKVNVASTFGNSITPGNYIDIYIKGVDSDKIMIGKLVSNVKVYAVKDSAGNHVFEDLSQSRSPSQIVLGVYSDMHQLLRTAEYIPGTELIIVPTTVLYNENIDGTEIVTEMTDSQTRAYVEDWMA